MLGDELEWKVWQLSEVHSYVYLRLHQFLLLTDMSISGPEIHENWGNVDQEEVLSACIKKEGLLL